MQERTALLSRLPTYSARENLLLSCTRAGLAARNSGDDQAGVAVDRGPSVCSACKSGARQGRGEGQRRTAKRQPARSSSLRVHVQGARTRTRGESAMDGWVGGWMGAGDGMDHPRTDAAWRRAPP